MNLGSWEPDSIGILSSYGAKAVSEVIVPPPLQNQHTLYHEYITMNEQLGNHGKNDHSDQIWGDYKAHVIDYDYDYLNIS